MTAALRRATPAPVLVLGMSVLKAALTQVVLVTPARPVAMLLAMAVLALQAATPQVAVRIRRSLALSASVRLMSWRGANPAVLL